MKRRLQNRIAESSVTLPAVCIVTLLLWWMPWKGYSLVHLGGVLVCALTAYVLIETDSVHALLRIRSRMISCLFLLLMAVCRFMHPINSETILQLCMAVTYYFLLRTYEHHHPEGSTFHAFLLLSVGSLVWPPLLLLTPVLIWNQGIFMRSLHWNSFCAAILGLLLPYVLWGTVLTGKMVFSILTTPVSDTPLDGITAFTPIVQHAAAVIAPFQEPLLWPPAIVSWTYHHPSECFALSVVLLVGLTGFIHYIRKSYDDKIRVRMCHYSFMLMQAVILFWLLLQPQYFPQLFPLFLLMTVPAAAHFVALTHTWFSNAWVVLLTLLIAAVAVITLTN